MIQRTWGERYRLNRRYLKIRSVRLGDSGVIVCKGVNGFGSQSVALNLVVRGRQKKNLPLGTEHTLFSIIRRLIKRKKRSPLFSVAINFAIRFPTSVCCEGSSLNLSAFSMRC